MKSEKELTIFLGAEKRNRLLMLDFIKAAHVVRKIVKSKYSRHTNNNNNNNNTRKKTECTLHH